MALRLQQQLQPHTHRVAIAGELRRMKQAVERLVLVVERKSGPDLFGGPTGTNTGLVSALRSWGQLVKGCPYTGQQIDLQPVSLSQKFGIDEKWDALGNPLPITIHFANATNWGLTWAMATGSQQYFEYRLGYWLAENGYGIREGYLRKLEAMHTYPDTRMGWKPAMEATGEIVPCPDEAALFRLVGKDLIDPTQRRWGAKRDPDAAPRAGRRASSQSRQRYRAAD